MPRVPIGSKLDEGSLKKVTDANRIYDVPQISEIWMWFKIKLPINVTIQGPTKSLPLLTLILVTLLL